MERARFQTLGAALAGLKQRIDELAPQARRKSVRAFAREIEPVRQVAVRAEVSGPGWLLPSVRGGVDLRGDGSTEAFTGHWRRRLISPQRGESAIEALRRVLVPES